ncbi:SpvB/TcaC N-terminal domain-containing protein [Micromonospora humi]|uniref:RHS repeat-associated core domain-containing protein n=1 Tax=Micromonospora humi TaxID=745366 RepID=A0A1C5J0A1_9ACTN|nr:SpvB/TcaC N-terminal domain-containing protein [Micromonospora humi]SCG64002.1 RHS repeat-associated core domain-containing protein [Micromonospora humi]
MNTFTPDDGGAATTAPAASDRAPTPTLPRAGGAIRGMGETFAASPVTGTGSLSIPVQVSPGRGGLGPQLALAYDSGAGNGPFGLGWQLSVPAISRRTDRGVPTYQDGHGERADADTFQLAGDEDLVPAVDAAGVVVERVREGYRVRRYRPRVEGAYTRVERWSSLTDPTDVFWRTVSGANLVSVFGRDAASRIADPADPTRIYSWLVSHVQEDTGDAILYGYAAEDDANVPTGAVSEAGRQRPAGRYLRTVRYGNRRPALDGDGDPRDPRTLPDDTWLFEVVLDYGQGHVTALPTGPDQREFVSARAAGAGTWPARQDATSSYRSGFEVRTHRLCRRVLMFHRFPRELGRADCLVRSTDLTYDEGPAVSRLVRVEAAGYRAQPTADAPDRYLRVAMPPLDLTYSAAPSAAELAVRASEAVDPDTLAYLPGGLHESHWLDLDGDGVAGLLTEEGAGWWFRRNLSPLAGRAEFAAPQPVAPRPAASLGAGARWLDLAGDGRADLVVLDEAARGFWERDDAAGWAGFRQFRSWPTVELDDPRVRLLDLSGDGRADLVIAEGDGFTWYPSLGEDGFGPAVRVPVTGQGGPRLVFAEATQTIFLADMSGDGLTDLARIRNGAVCYWPNLGHGRFGPKVVMDSAPWFDAPDRFDPARLRLADVDGTGPTDLVYLAPDGARLFLNQSGNSWTEGRRLDGFPGADRLAEVQVLDLLGTGTASLVWSSPLPGDAGHHLRHLPLTDAKPHLLTAIVNNLGARTDVRYTPSTVHALRDARDGRPWATHLPFPVQVVSQVQTSDGISGNRFTTRYAYHHGHYDADEREFRGFGMVEQWDDVVIPSVAGPASNHDRASDLPPALTRTWYHTGAWFEGPSLAGRYARGYWREGDAGDGEPGSGEPDAAALLLDDTVLPSALLGPAGRTPVTLTPRECREATRALRGSLLRQEVYALDGGEAQDRPYTVSERNYTVELRQRGDEARSAVFSVHPREQLDLNYERVLVDVAGKRRADPRMTHTVTVAVDAYGTVLRTLAVAYRRRQLPGVDLPEQLATHLLLRATRVANHAEDDWHRIALPVEAATFEVVGGPQPQVVDTRVLPLRHETLTALVEELFPIGADAPATDRLWPFERWDWRDAPPEAPMLRPLSRARTLYRRDDLTGPLPLGVAQSRALPYETYTLALTEGLVAQAYTGPAAPLLSDPSVLTGPGGDQGGYVAMDGGWWAPSGRVLLSPSADPAAPVMTAAAELAHARAHFFLPCQYVDPFGQATLVGYDEADLLVTTTRDAVGQVWTATNDYRVLQPWRVTDPNGNRGAVVFDALGLVAAAAVQGRAGQLAGDDVTGFDPDPAPAALRALVADPHATAAAMLGQATTRTVYDLHRFARCGQPAVAVGLSREVHAADPGGHAGPISVSLTFSDGFGREIQRKVQAEAGPAPLRETDPVAPSGDVLPGALRRDGGGVPVIGAVARRWVGTGRTVFNNKAKPVRRYEPFFSATPLFESEPELVETGVSPVLFYDPLARVVATLSPDHGYGKVVFDAWQQATWDANDTVLDDPRTDPDVAGLVAAYLAAQPPDWRTWHQRRAGGQLGPAEQDAARKAAAHAGTPGLVRIDPLGRAVRTVVHNRYERAGTTIEEVVVTRSVIDGGGLQRAVVDGLGRTAARFTYDVRGGLIHQAGADTGESWQLTDATGRPIRSWDGHGRRTRDVYDALRRPVSRHLTGAVGADPGLEITVARTVYGDDPATGLTRAQARDLNLLTHVYQRYDSAGVVTNLGIDPASGQPQAYDFKGNPLRGSRRLVTGHAADPDWGAAVAPALDEPMTTATTYNARDEVVTVTAPDGSVVLPGYNEAGLLERVDVRRPGAAGATAYLRGVEHDARGRRVEVSYGNGVTIRQEYDPVTARLTARRATRAPIGAEASPLFTDASVVQDVRYGYDPVGNLLRVADAAPAPVFFDNRRVEALREYTYDAAYRLLSAGGREQVGQVALDPSPPSGAGRRDLPFVGARAHPADLRAMRSYVEHYEYDPVGNLTRLRHVAGATTWVRDYEYATPSLLEPTRVGDRLTRSTLGGFTETYRYDEGGRDAGGVLTALNSLSLGWDHAHRLRRVDLGGGGVAHYVYDGAGNRVRKVIERDGVVRSERVYASGFERYREFANGRVTLERTTLHVLDGAQPVALVETQTVADGVAVPAPAAVLRYQVGDLVGSACLELDAVGGLISYEEYHPFGTTALQTGAGGAEVSVKRYRFTGRERDEETGFAYHGARFYAPWLGRWTSADPIGLGDGINVWAYAHNRPVCCTDTGGTAGFEKVETEDPSANYYYDQDKGVTIRDSAQLTELWVDVGAHQVDRVGIKFKATAQDVITPNKPITKERLAKDIKNMSPQAFQDRYGVGAIEYGVLADALIPPPEPIVVPEDKMLYMGAGGRTGTAEDLDAIELGERIANIQQPTIVGSLYGVTAVALGADAQEAARMINLGNSVDNVVMAGLFVGAGAGRLGGKGGGGSGAFGGGGSGGGSGSGGGGGTGGGGGGSGGGGGDTPGYRRNADGKVQLNVLPGATVPQRDVQQVFQGAVSQVDARLRMDPVLAGKYMRNYERDWGGLGLFGQRMAYGHAVERALAAGAAPTGLLIHTGDNLPLIRGGPDFVGAPGTPFAGKEFQVTTQSGYYTHVYKAAPGTYWGLYPTYTP